MHIRGLGGGVGWGGGGGGGADGWMDKRALHRLGLRSQPSGLLAAGSHSVKHLFEMMFPAGQRAQRFFLFIFRSLRLRKRYIQGGIQAVSLFLEVNDLNHVLSHSFLFLVDDHRSRCQYCCIYYVICNATTRTSFLFLKLNISLIHPALRRHTLT